MEQYFNEYRSIYYYNYWKYISLVITCGPISKHNCCFRNRFADNSPCLELLQAILDVDCKELGIVANCKELGTVANCKRRWPRRRTSFHGCSCPEGGIRARLYFSVLKVFSLSTPLEVLCEGSKRTGSKRGAVRCLRGISFDFVVSLCMRGRNDPESRLAMFFSGTQ